MAEFQLPHDHGASSQAASLHQEVMQVAHFAAAAEVFKQLSDPTRVRIFWLLSHQEACVINLAAMLEMSSPAVSHHLRSLTESGLLVSRRDGKALVSVPQLIRRMASQGIPLSPFSYHL